MENCLSRLTALGKSKRITQPEQAIQNSLFLFDSFLPDSPTPDEISVFESTLLSLLHINGGILSPHCSFFIAQQLISVYNLEKYHRFWNLTTMATSSPNPAVLWALSYVIRKIGQFQRSSLASLPELLVQMKDSLIFPALVTLRAVFKVCAEMVSKSAPVAQQFATRQLSNAHEPTQIAAVRLLQGLVPFGTISLKKLTGDVEANGRYFRSRFVVEEVAYLVALCAYVPNVRREEAGAGQNNEFALHAAAGGKSKGLADSFPLLRVFRLHFRKCFGRFLDLLEPNFIFAHAMELVEFALSVEPGAHELVTDYFAGDVRSEVLTVILKAKLIGMLPAVVFDLQSAKNALPAALAAILQRGNEMDPGAQFLTKVALDYPDIVPELLEQKIYQLRELKGADDLGGTAEVIAILLGTVKQRSEFIKIYKIGIERFLKDVASSAKPPVSTIEAYFRILSVVPLSFGNKEFITDQLAVVWDLTDRFSSFDARVRRSIVFLAEALVFFLAAHPNIENASAFFEPLIPLLGLFSNSALVAFLIFVCHSSIYDDEALTIATFFITRLAGCVLTPAAIRRHIPSLIPLPDESCSSEEPPPRETPIVDEQELPHRICRLLVGFFSGFSDADFSKLLQLILKHAGKIPVALFLFHLYQSESTNRHFSATFHEQLLKVALPENVVQSQIIAECAVSHCLVFPATVMKLPRTALSWLVEGALARRYKMPDGRLVEFLTRAITDAAIPQLTDFVLHALAELYDAKSMQLVQLNIGDQQCQFFINLLNRHPEPNSFTLFLLANAVVRLFPVLLPTLTTDATGNFLKLILSALRLSPIGHGRVLFQTVFRAAIAFAPDVAGIFPVRFPKSSHAETALKLCVCGSLADLSRLVPLGDLFDLVDKLIVLLQKTKDRRVANFVVTIATAQEFVPERMKAWFGMAKQILAAGTTPGFGHTIVEPTIPVKCCALRIIHALLPLIAQKVPLLTDCLDDLMASTIRAIESNKLELHHDAYPILSAVVREFRFRGTDGQSRLLDLYESNFSLASRYAFPDSLEIAAGFLVDYLDFAFDRFEKNKQAIFGLIDDYIAGLERVIERTSGFFRVASKICVLARSIPELFDRLSPFLKTLSSAFSQLILDSIELRGTLADWTDISTYRKKMSPFYGDLLPSAVWLQHVFPDTAKVTVDAMTCFFLLELGCSSEIWRFYAAFSALSTVLQYFGPILEAELLLGIVSACSEAAKKNATSLRPLIRDFLFHSASNLQDKPGHAAIWRGIVSILFGPASDCTAKTVALVLRNSQAGEMTGRFAALIVARLRSGQFSEDEGIGLFTILYQLSPKEIPSFVEVISHEEQDRFVHFTMNALRKAVLACPETDVVDRAAAFSTKHFQAGGLALVAQLFVRRPDLGLQLLLKGALDEAVNAVTEGIDLAKSSLQFLALALFQIRHEPARFDVALTAGKAAVSAILKWSKDRKKGKEVTIEAIRVLRDGDLVANGSSSRVFADIPKGERDKVVKLLQGIAAASKPTASKLSLKLFSGNSRRKAVDEGEWQSLEADL
jgi:hypothetical protein